MRCAKRMAQGEQSNEDGGVGQAKIAHRFKVLVLAGVLALVSTSALADDYDPKQAGHPLRIVAYAVHPVGVALDYLLMRPLHWIVSYEPIKTIFGHTE